MHRQTQRALERIRQGNFAESVLLPGEDAAQFYELCDQLLLEFCPCGPAEEECLLSIAAPLWRKLRLHMPGATSERTTASESPASRQAKTQGPDPKDLMQQRQIMAELDAQISQAMKQMAALKQMKTAGALTR